MDLAGSCHTRSEQSQIYPAVTRNLVEWAGRVFDLVGHANLALVINRYVYILCM